jgi:molecular chaperone DnaK (HSP70)
MPESGDVVKTWPGIEGLAESSKVPTQIYYEGNNIKWGFNIPAGKKPLRWFKLLLLREEDLKPPYIDTAVRNSAYIKETKEMLSKLHKSAEDVVADYLGLLWKTVLEAIRTVLGAAMDGQPLRVVLTFPAIWPVYAQHRMKAAAETAGILDPRIGAEPTKLHLCAEPEAAALAVMHDANGQPVEVRMKI